MQGIKSFKTDTFKAPTQKEDALLQQSIASAFIENFSRKAPIFDSYGREI